MWFFRIILVLIFGIFLLSVLKAVLRMIGALFAFAVATPAPPPAPPKRAALPATGELKRDPVCGRYILVGTALTKTSRGETLHFCSAECLARYREA